MKKPTIFNIVLLGILLLARPALAVEEERPHDGYWWQCVGFEETQLVTTCKLLQLAYLQGYVNALSGAVLEAQIEQRHLKLNIKQMKNKEDQDLMSLSLFFYGIIGRDLTGMTYGQLQDGLTKFYSDFRNKQIDVDDAIEIVKLQVRGEKKAYIDCMEEVLRLQYQKKFDDAFKRTKECDRLAREGPK